MAKEITWTEVPTSHRLGSLILAGCSMCGALTIDRELHQRWHNGEFGRSMFPSL